jgi:hypothetical protein
LIEIRREIIPAMIGTRQIIPASFAPKMVPAINRAIPVINVTVSDGFMVLLV